MAKPPIAWSHSAVDLFRQCPHRYYKTRISKEYRDEFKGPAAEWGLKVHKAMERRIKMGNPLPANMKQYEKLAARLDAIPGAKFTELQLALDVNYEEVEWFASEAWCRIIIDLLIIHPAGRTAFVFDYKTGKIRDETRQLALCAAGIFKKHPDVDKVIAGYIWMNEQRLAPATFLRKYSDRLWNLYLPHVAVMEDSVLDGNWPKKPTGLCNGWCPVQSCKFWQPKQEK